MGQAKAVGSPDGPPLVQHLWQGALAGVEDGGTGFRPK